MSLNCEKVTVIVPTFDHIDKLEICIESLLSQNYSGELEVIIIDNSPHFQLNLLVEKYPDILFLHEPNSGSYNARNKGLKFATGKYIAFTDSDCVADSEWIAKAVEFYENNTEIDYLVGRVQVFPVNKLHPTYAELYEVKFAFPQDVFLSKEHFGATANLIVKASAIKSIGPFNGKLKSSGDKEWGQRAWKKGYKGAYCESVIVCHPARLHSEIISKSQRVCGGLRDKEPGWFNCFKHVYYFLRPPRRMITQVIKCKQFNTVQKIMISLYCIYLTWVRAYFRFKLELLNLESRRS